MAVFVEVTPAKSVRIDRGLQLSLLDPPAAGLELVKRFRSVKPVGKPDRLRFIARLAEATALKPGKITLPVAFQMMVGSSKTRKAVKGRFDVILRTLPSARAPGAKVPTGIALVGGALELRLGHLCDQRGCVQHFHKSLVGIPGLAAVRPQPGLKNPRAIAYLRAGHAVDVWGLREKLRDRGVEVRGIVPRQLTGYRLRVELSRWQIGGKPRGAEQWIAVRDRVRLVLEKSALTRSVTSAGGGINVEPAKPEADLIGLLDAVAEISTVPSAVWLVPRGVSMPKTAPARVALAGVEKPGGSEVHPVIEFEFGPTRDADAHVLALLRQQSWAVRIQRQSDEGSSVVGAAIGARKYAGVMPLLHKFRAAGRVPRQIRLSNFGDIRIQIDFVHVCGEVEYSKPRKRSSKSKKKPKKPEKPFVPKPLRPAKSSNARQAIEAAIAGVSWVRQAVYHDYHTRPVFRGPKRFQLVLQVKGKDVVRLDELIDALRRAGFPPKSVMVSRRFPGIPFAKRLPNDLKVKDRNGKTRTLWSLRRANRPFVVAFVSLKCRHRRHKKYKADPKLYERLEKTIGKYKNRVDFVTVSANSGDKFKDVVKFLDKTNLKLPVLHDGDGSVRRVFNAQATPPPHVFVFDGDGRLRYAGDPHDQWEKPKSTKNDILAKALDLVLAKKYQVNGAVFFNKSLCNCSDPKCKCPKCGCGPSCRCGIRH